MERISVLLLLLIIFASTAVGEELHMTGTETEDFDTILFYIGIGKWNIILYVAMSYWNIVLPHHALAGAFLSPSVDHTCRPPAHAPAPTTLLLNNATTSAHNATPSLQGVFMHDPICSYLKEDTETGRVEQVPCTEWDFDNSTFSSTVTSEFGLVCDRQYLRAAHQSMYMGGFLVGALVSGYLAYRYGRLRIIIVATVAYMVMALGSAWLPSLGALLTFRFLLGIMHPTSMATGYILMMEVTEIKWRATVMLISASFWGVGTMLWGLFAYLERDWRLLQTYASLLTPVMLPAFFFIDESPRWLVVTGRHKEAVKVLRKAARMNGKTLPSNDRLLAIMKNVQEQSTSSDVKGLRQLALMFSTRKMITITIATSIGFFTVAMVFFGLTLAATALDIEDPFTFMLMSGLVELPSGFGFYFMDKYGRKKFGISVFGLCAVSLLLQPLVPDNLKWLSITLVMIGKLASSCAFGIMYLYTGELYPTEIRTQGMGVGLMSSRVGAFISPFIMSALEPRHPWAISVVFGGMAAVAAVSFLPLWETANICLPDTIAQLEAQQKVSTRKPGDRTQTVFESVPSDEKTAA